MWTRRDFLKVLASTTIVGLPNRARILSARGLPEEGDRELRFGDKARSSFGEWSAEASLSPARWEPGRIVRVDLSLHFAPSLIKDLSDALALPIDSLLMLVTSERCFDAAGFLRLPSDERMSTLLTPTGLPIEGGTVGAISRVVGSRFRNPVDQLVQMPVGENVHFACYFALPNDTPPGLYRLRFDFGVQARRRRSSLNSNQGFASRSREPETKSLMYSPPIGCDGFDESGRHVSASKIRPRIYWVLLGEYNSNGYRGAVAREDQPYFALSSRNIIQDEVVLPLFDNWGSKLRYNLEPLFPADTIEGPRNIPWNYSSGELSIRITDPLGKTSDLGTLPFRGQRGQGPTTGNARFTAWRPSGYGLYTVQARGWIADRWGSRYEGGGTYTFWIARRMTMATATFQGMAYPTGSSYGRDIAFSPAVPADVRVKVDLYPDSDPRRVKTSTYTGRASEGGIFGVAQGMKPFALDVPGEYHAHILATHKDSDGHLWVCSMRHAGVVYPDDTPIMARGKKIKVDNQLVDRGETHREGFIEPTDNFRNLDHLNFPYRSGDVLLLASEGQGANKIEPVLTYDLKNVSQPYDARLQPIGATNVRIMTSNGLSPHLYPETITDWAYYYAGAPRPGFSSRFLVGEDGVVAPYWPTSATNFGGQFGASSNGDQPGDIYRLLGGIVLHRRSERPLYAGYLSSAFILPGGTGNNRVIAPGSEDIIGADGRKYRFFLVSVRPGMVYEQNATFVPFFQIDPILPVHVHFKLLYPDGRERRVEGTGDNFGSFVGRERWPLDRSGVYRYTVEADWEGHRGVVPGLPDEGGYLFVLENPRPTAAQPLDLMLENQQGFNPEKGLQIEGHSTGQEVYFTALTPGAVVDQGRIPVKDGSFRYLFNPEAIHRRIPIYDIENRRTGRKEIGRIIHLTFFSEEKTATGTPYHAFARVIFRGSTAIYTR